MKIELDRLKSKATSPINSIYLDASAGSGKTTILIDRLLRLMLDDCQNSRILCLTHTNIGTIQIYNRLRDKLHHWFHVNDSIINQELETLTGNIPDEKLKYKARSLFKNFISGTDAPRIQTIHSFSSGILEKYHNGYQEKAENLITEKSAQLLFAEILYDRMSSLKNEQSIKYDELKQAMDRLLQQYTEDTLVSIVGAIHKHLERTDGTYKELLQIRSTDELLKFSYQWKNNHCFNTSKDNIQTINEMLESFFDSKFTKQLIEQTSIDIGTINNQKNHSSTIKLKQICDALLEKNHVVAYEKLYTLCYTRDGKKRKKLFNDNNKHIAIQELCVNFDQLYQSISKKKYIILLEDLGLISAYLLWEYNQYKKSKNIFEYHDILTLAYEILSKDEQAVHLLYNIDCSLQHILIDEAQDLSLVQWKIIKTITTEFFNNINLDEKKKKTIFMVGDFKQSIFGFQGAKPELFQEIAQSFQQNATYANHQWYNIDLDINFRSAPEILTEVDQRFHSLPQWRKHQAYNTTLKGKVEVIRSIADIASMVKSWLKNNYIISGTSNKVQPSDIMILVRKRDSKFNTLLTELKKNNIPINCLAMRFKENRNFIAELMLILTKFVIIPYDDLNLAALLKSPIIGISEEQLFEIAYKRQSNIFNEIIIRSSTSSFWLIIYQKLYFLLDARKKYNDIRDFYNYSCIKLELNDNYRHIWNVLVNSCSPSSHYSLEQFLQHMLSNPEIFDDIMTKQDDNGVIIQTIHGAKGTEASIVILADNFGNISTKHYPHENLLWKDGWFLFNSKEKIEEIDQARKIRNKEIMEEELRLLYVAMTRAKNELYMINNDHLQYSHSLASS